MSPETRYRRTQDNLLHMLVQYRSIKCGTAFYAVILINLRSTQCSYLINDVIAVSYTTSQDIIFPPSKNVLSYDLHNLLVEFRFVVSPIWSIIVYVVVPCPDDDLFRLLVFVNLIHHAT